jgi:hypothetical protein
MWLFPHMTKVTCLHSHNFMNKYLQGYLSSIPPSEYNNIITYLEQNMANKVSMSEEELKYMLSELAKQKKPLTQSTETIPDEKPSDTYNRFYNLVSIDIAYLYEIINALYNSIDNYTYLSASYFSDIKSEMDKLESKIKEFKARRDYDNNTIVVTETFKNTESFEKYNSDTAYLFVDRDGTQLVPVDIIHNNTDDMITLHVNSVKDLLHNKSGKTIAMIKVLDYRGIPTDTYNTPEYAIDNSDVSYWECSVVSDEPINIPMDDLEPGGAYIKFKIYLTKVHKISEISITPFCIYPVEICKITIGDQEVLSTLTNPNNISESTMTFNIRPVTSDEIEIVMRQKNHTYDIIRTNSKIEEAEELWNSLINLKKESYVKSPDAETEYNDDTIYLKYMKEKETEITNWNKDYIREAE